MRQGRRQVWQRGTLMLALVALAAATARGQDADRAAEALLEQMTGQPETAAAAEDAPADPGRPIALADEQVDVSAEGLVTLNAVDLPRAKALRLLSLETQRNIVATPSVQGTVTASLQNVTFEEALDAILIANQAAYRSEGKFIYVYTREELAEIIAAENPPVTRVFRLSYVPAAEVEKAVEPLLSPIGSASASVEPETGISTGTEDAGGASLASSDYLVVFDRPDNLAAIEAVIKELDVRPRQVLLEATVLSAELSEDNALGVDFALVGGVDLQGLSSTSSAIQDVSLGDLPAGRFEKFNSSAITAFTDNVPDGGIRVGIVKDNVAVFVQALEQVTDTVVIANPKVLALNKQKGQVIVGRRDGYITTTVTETQAIQTVEFLETGTNLIFRPFIGEDDFVRLELHPEDSTGGLNADNLPFAQTTEVTTNVIVKDGQTVLIGGLFREVDTDTRSQIPVLGDIPIAGALFQSRNDGVTRQEVIILLTVHLVKDFDAYAQQSWEQYEDMERLRVGLRRGQMQHGRERIAQALYQRALEHYAAGEYGRARWNVRMALHNNPRMRTAILLQEDLRRKREWDDDGTVTRSFIHDAIMRKRGFVEPMFDRPAPPFVRPDALQGRDEELDQEDPNDT